MGCLKNMSSLNVTEMVQRYRQALRFVWNSCIWVDEGLRNWESVYSWRELKIPLFKTLIADPLGLQTGETMFGPTFQVVPNSMFVEGFPEIAVDTRPPDTQDGAVWRSVKGPFKSDQVRLTLLDIADFTPMGYIDLRFYVVLVDYFQPDQSSVGHRALVDVTFADVLWNDGIHPMNTT